MADLEVDPNAAEGEEGEEEEEQIKYANLDLNEAFKVEVTDVFDMFDSNKAQRVPSSELNKILQWLGFNPTMDDCKGFKDRFDPHRTEEISLESFYAIVDEMMESPDTIEQLVEALSMFDHDHDGKITVPEFRWAMSKLGDAFDEREVDDIVKEMDKEGTGFIEIMPFCRMSFGVKEEKPKDSKGGASKDAKAPAKKKK